MPLGQFCTQEKSMWPTYTKAFVKRVMKISLGEPQSVAGVKEPQGAP